MSDPLKLELPLSNAAQTEEDNGVEENWAFPFYDFTASHSPIPIPEKDSSSDSDSDFLRHSPPITGTFQCVHCSLKYSDIDSYVLHTRTAHFKSNYRPDAHADADQEWRPPKKRKKFAMEKKTETYADTDVVPVPDQIFECGVCEKTFTNFELRKDHTFTAHSLIGQSLSATMNCKYCGQGFRSQTNLYTHLNVHLISSKDKSFKCTECGAGFNQRGQLKKHSSLAHDGLGLPPTKRIGRVREELSFECATCFQLFPAIQQLQDHCKKNHINRNKSVQVGSIQAQGVDEVTSRRIMSEVLGKSRFMSESAGGTARTVGSWNAPTNALGSVRNESESVGSRRKQQLEFRNVTYEPVKTLELTSQYYIAVPVPVTPNSNFTHGGYAPTPTNMAYCDSDVNNEADNDQVIESDPFEGIDVDCDIKIEEHSDPSRDVETHGTESESQSEENFGIFGL